MLGLRALQQLLSKGFSSWEAAVQTFASPPSSITGLPQTSQAPPRSRSLSPEFSTLAQGARAFLVLLNLPYCSPIGGLCHMNLPLVCSQGQGVEIQMDGSVTDFPGFFKIGHICAANSLRNLSLAKNAAIFSFHWALQLMPYKSRYCGSQDRR